MQYQFKCTVCVALTICHKPVAYLLCNIMLASVLCVVFLCNYFNECKQDVLLVKKKHIHGILVSLQFKNPFLSSHSFFVKLHLRPSNYQFTSETLQIEYRYMFS